MVKPTPVENDGRNSEEIAMNVIASTLYHANEKSDDTCGRTGEFFQLRTGIEGAVEETDLSRIFEMNFQEVDATIHVSKNARGRALPHKCYADDDDFCGRTGEGFQFSLSDL